MELRYMVLDRTGLRDAQSLYNCLEGLRDSKCCAGSPQQSGSCANPGNLPDALFQGDRIAEGHGKQLHEVQLL